MSFTRLIRVTVFIAFVVVGNVSQSVADIATCDVHNGMKIWYLDYANDDYSLAHPLGVREGIIDINEGPWHKKCAVDGANSKVFIPFDPVSGPDKGQMDSRFAKGIFRTRAEALRAYRRLI